MAKIIRVNGSIELLTSLSFEDLQKAVGGYIERVKMPDGRVMYVNEDARLKDLPLNVEASQWLGAPILGDVVVMTIEEEKVQNG